MEGFRKPSHMRLRHTKEMYSLGKFVYFGKFSKFSTDSFLFFFFILGGYLTPSLLFPLLVVWTNCAA